MYKLRTHFKCIIIKNKFINYIWNMTLEEVPNKKTTVYDAFVS